MRRSLHGLSGPNPYASERFVTYGYEWELDFFDRRANLLVRADADNLGQVDAKLFALDIGCGYGERAKNLAELCIFDTVYACDIEDRRNYITEKNVSLTKKNCNGSLHEKGLTKIGKIDFVQANAAKLTASHFNNKKFAYINCRNVGHFLAPIDFRHALKAIATLSDDGALVTISFNKAQNRRTQHYASLFDKCDGVEYYNNRGKHSETLFTTYRVAQVCEFLRSLNFSIILNHYCPNVFS